MHDATKKVITRLKEVRLQKGLSYQDIVDACEEQGDHVSMSSVRRIFAKDSENGSDFRTFTVDAIFRAVVGTEELELTAAEEAALTDTEKEIVTENAALKAVVELRDATIEELQRQIEALNEEKADLKSTINTMQIKLDTTADMFKLAMESIGKSVAH